IDRYGEDYSDQAKERTLHELRVVKKMGFPSYFLVVADLVNWAKNNGIRVGWGRGSAAGSIISYALRITNLDPIRFGLLFERFLVEGRKSMPDIDLDFDDRRRHEVISYAREKYGENRVAHIGTFSRVKAKSAIKDAARVLGYEFNVANDLTKLMPTAVLGIEPSIDESLEKSPDFRKMYENDTDVQKIINAARGLEGVYRQTGIHAAGVVIGKSDIIDFVPVMQRPDKDGTSGLAVTQWDMHRVEECGLLKVDFLGLTNLGTIDICVQNIADSRGEEIDIETISLEDDLTYQKMCEGQSIGTFQLESSGMREMMVSLQPSSIEDVMALISLYRPGPLGSGMDKMFINGKHGRVSQDTDHPLMGELLKSTYGFMLYQEDVLSVARSLAGFTAGEADDLRKAIGKKQMDKIGQFRKKFVEGAAEKNNIPGKIANKIYSDIEYFGGYGFNLAHAASYAMVSYITSYLKFHYPAEYMAALLSTTKTQNDAAKYLNECRNMDIDVLPPSINKSGREFKVLSHEKILFGLSSITGMGDAKVDFLLNARKDDEYENLYDMMRRADPDMINKATFEHLAYSGSFDEIIPGQNEVPILLKDKMEILSLEGQNLGLNVIEHPIESVWSHVSNYVDTTIEGMSEYGDQERVSIAGVISGKVQKYTKRGDKMFVLQVQDLTGTAEVVVFPKEAISFGEEADVGSVVVINGAVKQDSHLPKMILGSYFLPELPEYSVGKVIEIDLGTSATYAQLNRMKELVEENPGQHPVVLKVHDTGNSIDAVLQFTKPANKDIEQDLQLIGRSTFNV
ncbi:MAG: DNA polymerase III subunit alpha, partial [Actinobacteria bacterium]|nr:DNA polymerase III subunit alpha [Actinomycetota bacterium]